VCMQAYLLDAATQWRVACLARLCSLHRRSNARKPRNNSCRQHGGTALPAVTRLCMHCRAGSLSAAGGGS
jgi:hypothetical protein